MREATARFQELLRLARQRHHAIFADRQECVSAAHRIMVGLPGYLGFPGSDSGAVIYFVLGPNGEWFEEVGSVSGNVPRLTAGDDGFWMFGVQFRFGPMTLTSAFGIKSEGDQFVFRRRGIASINPADPEQVRELREAIHQEIREELASLWRDPPRQPYGFHPDLTQL